MAKYTRRLGEFVGGVLWRGSRCFFLHYDKDFELWQSTMTKVNYYKVHGPQDFTCTLTSWFVVVLQKLVWKILHYDKVVSHKNVTQPFIYVTRSHTPLWQGKNSHSSLKGLTTFPTCLIALLHCIRDKAPSFLKQLTHQARPPCHNVVLWDNQICHNVVLLLAITCIIARLISTADYA